MPKFETISQINESFIALSTQTALTQLLFDGGLNQNIVFFSSDEEQMEFEQNFV